MRIEMVEVGETVAVHTVAGEVYHLSPDSDSARRVMASAAVFPDGFSIPGDVFNELQAAARVPDDPRKLDRRFGSLRNAVREGRIFAWCRKGLHSSRS